MKQVLLSGVVSLSEHDVVPGKVAGDGWQVAGEEAVDGAGEKGQNQNLYVLFTSRSICLMSGLCLLASSFISWYFPSWSRRCRLGGQKQEVQSRSRTEAGSYS